MTYRRCPVKIAHPRTLDEALEALQRMPDAQLLAGGTDFVVEVNFGHRRPPAVVGLRRVAELQGWRRDDGQLVLGAGLTFTEIENELVEELPALAAAARTVGSPQMRNAGTIGGNLGTASPAGGALPGLAAPAPWGPPPPPPSCWPGGGASAACPSPSSSPGSSARPSRPVRSSARSACPGCPAPSTSSRSAPATPW